MFDLNRQLAEIDAEKAFLQDGCEKAKETYETKRKQHHVGEQSLFTLAWEIDGFEKLIKLQDDVVAMIHSIQEMMQLASPRRVNVPRQLSELRKQLEEYIKGVTTKRREAASHLLVFMVSDEQRSSKPYAIPIRALPYRSITDDMVRRLRDEIRDAMHELGMLAVGKKLCFHITDFHLLVSFLPCQKLLALKSMVMCSIGI